MWGAGVVVREAHNIWNVDKSTVDNKVWLFVIMLAVSPHSFPFIRLQHTQLNNYPYLSLLKPSHEITQQKDKHKHDHDYDL
jgi:hypothetical protein